MAGGFPPDMLKRLGQIVIFGCMAPVMIKKRVVFHPSICDRAGLWITTQGDNPNRVKLNSLFASLTTNFGENIAKRDLCLTDRGCGCNVARWELGSKCVGWVCGIGGGW